MRAVYGAFFVEVPPASPARWTEEDERRLRGQMVVRTAQGTRLAPPHVMCPGGPFIIGNVPLPAPGAKCWGCGALRVRERHCDGARFCFACGRLQ